MSILLTTLGEDIWNGLKLAFLILIVIPAGIGILIGIVKALFRKN